MPLCNVTQVKPSEQSGLNIRATQKGRINLQATQVFKDHRSNAEKKIFDLIKKRLDEIIDKFEYDW
jgi:hypothetical protein